MRPRLLLSLLVVVVTLLGSSVAAEARGRRWEPPPPPPLPELVCGELPDHDVRLSADLTCTEPFLITQPFWGEEPRPYLYPGTGLRPMIDLGGHTLDVSAIDVACYDNHWSTESCGLIGPFRIVNGTIRGNLSNTASLDRVTVHGDIRPGYVPGGVRLDFTMSRSAVVDGLVSLDWMATIERSVFVRSRIGRGPYNEIGHTLVVTDSTFVDSPSPAIIIVDTSDWRSLMAANVERNLFLGSQGPSVVVRGEEHGAREVVVRGNIVAGGHDDGIRVQLVGWRTMTQPVAPDGGPFRIGSNLAVGNAGHGISVTVDHPDHPEHPSVVVDEGGNRAIWNGLDPQCEGIVC